jgi:hypothetical protein
MLVYEVYHSLPTGINDRIFPFLMIHAKISPSEFIVISLPLADTHLLPKSNIPSHASGGKSAIVAKYVAVERVRILHDAGKEEPTDAKSKVEWLMCTSSDAGGWLPIALQRGKIPGEIAKDVGLFLGWVGGNRGKKLESRGRGEGEEEGEGESKRRDCRDV